MIRRLLKRFADAALQKRVVDLEQRLDAAERKQAVAETEVESMADVIARDRARIKSETAAYTRQQAEAEGRPNDERTDESIRRFSA